MDNTRLILVFALSFVLLLLWQAWQRDYGSGAQLAAPAGHQVAAPADVPQDAALPPAPPDAAVVAAADAGTSGRRIRVRTDVLEVAIDEAGATLERAALPDYPVSIKEPDHPLLLLDDSQDLFFVIQGGLIGDPRLPDHRALYASTQGAYDLAAADTLEVPLTWQGPDGLSVRRIFTFTRGSYAVGVRVEIANAGAAPLAARQYAQLQRRAPDSSRGMIYTFTGVALSTPENRFEKLQFDELAEDPVDRTAAAGWIGMIQHYFVTALVPPAQQEYTYYSKALGEDRYAAGFYGPPLNLDPGGSATSGYTVYIGPKIQDDLERLAPGLDLSVDYGALWFLAKPLFIILTGIHALVQNWGWSIILLTILVKAAFFYPSAVGYRSMAKMRRVTPRLQAIRERYAEDRQRMQQAMMELYKEEKINPLSGCLPILIQIPVFIALYWVLLESVELRQAPFVLWLKDLSTADPYFVLPLVMGVTMFVQQKLNPAPLDPVQQKVMQILPLVFTVMFAWFPSGLVLYWVVSNILSIAQQWVITRRIESGAQA